MDKVYYSESLLSKKSQMENAMNKNTTNLGVAYYTALGEKNIEKLEKYLHPSIQLVNTQDTLIGKEAVVKAAEGFTKIFRALTIRTQFDSENQAMVVYEVEIPGLSKKLQAASLFNFQEGLISKIEVFYDSKVLSSN